MVRGFPSNPLRMILLWKESWEGAEVGYGREKKRLAKTARRIISIFFRPGTPYPRLEMCEKPEYSILIR
jgi:hypothetical protein